MKLLCAILFSIFIGIWTACAELPAGWSTNYDETFSQAALKQEPVLVFFTASWCGPCKLMSQITLSDPTIGPALGTINHVAVDIDAQSGLAAKFGISAVPAFILLTANGDEVERSTGFQPIGEFLPWLTNNVLQARKMVIQLAMLKSQLSDVDPLLVSTNAEARQKAATELFTLCAVRDQTIARAASTRLQTLAAQDPLIVLNGLNDVRLQTRILTANALRDCLGKNFEVDPWADADTRSKAVEKWRNKLTATTGPVETPF